MPSLAGLTVALILFAAPSQSQQAFGPEPSAAADSNEASVAEHEAEASDTADPREAAKQEFDRGLEAVANREYEAAVAAFERAYRLRPHPVTLFNLALALEKAGRLPESWEVFDDVLDIVGSDAERREVRQHMQAIAEQIAIVEIDARPRARLCIDGLALPKQPTGGYRLAITPGQHRLLLDDHEFELEFDAGDRRVLLLDDFRQVSEGRKRSRALPATIGLAVGGGALALGLGVGAAIVPQEPTRTGLTAGAAGSAGLALVAGIAALVIESRIARGSPQERPAPGRACPGNPELDQRIDLQLAPLVDRPVEFAGLDGELDDAPQIELPVPPLPKLAAFPHPRSIAPPRSAQNRPTTTSPM